MLLTVLGAASPTASLDVDVTSLRSEKGVVRICLTADPDRFPGCVGDTAAIRRTVPASAPKVRMTGLAPGSYALSVIHDENGNRKLDTFAGIPREGFGFSRNPAIRFGPPKFDSAEFDVRGDATTQQVRIRYLL